MSNIECTPASASSQMAIFMVEKLKMALSLMETSTFTWIYFSELLIHVEGGTEKHVCTSFVNKIEAEKIVDKLAEGIFS
jgi:hypothetical protein